MDYRVRVIPIQPRDPRWSLSVVVGPAKSRNEARQLAMRKVTKFVTDRAVRIVSVTEIA